MAGALAFHQSRAQVSAEMAAVGSEAATMREPVAMMPSASASMGQMRSRRRTRKRPYLCLGWGDRVGGGCSW